MDASKKPQVKIKLVEINSHLTCPLCKGYFVDATTISECLHSFCRSCIIKFLHENSYCPICELLINKAKPNLKLDKTLQDIVYKLVPELFLNEMRRRQRFYRSYPDLATKVTPEEKGEDTERMIFNPRDTISLSIEYISDDSTPGAIVIPQLIGKGADSNNKNSANELTDEDGNNAIKRFLQCPGMCRIDVLKKFIRNKYNVDTNQYYIDILYKRVPLPDHYTLIDVAYIYSWKRNEPMKFFFKITDINLVTDSFDYLIPPQIKRLPEKRTPKRQSRNAKTVVQDTDGLVSPVKNHETSLNKVPEPRSDSKHKLQIEKIQSPKAAKNNPEIKMEENDNAKKKCDYVETTADKDNMVRIQKEAIEQFRKNEKRKEFTNVTLDRNNHVEIITKIQKVSNKSGLQIGIKITKQTFKKNQLPKLLDSADSEQEPDKIPPKPIETSPKLTSQPVPPDLDLEKSNFLKSIELTAKHVIKAMVVPQMLDLPKVASKRKNSSPVKSKKCAKRPKKYVNIQPKAIQNPAVWEMVSNVNQNVTNLSKIVEQMTPPSSINSDLQALLYDSYKINIPSSLSVTVKNEKDTPSPSYQKPVQNYIEILKLPDAPALLKAIEPSGDSRPNSLAIPSKIEVKSEPQTPEAERKIPHAFTSKDIEIKIEGNCDNAASPKLTDSTKAESLPKLSPRTPQTFQRMFEETLKKTENGATPPQTNGATPLQTNGATPPQTKGATPPQTPENNNVQNTALNLTTTDSGVKRKITEIASILYKKKLESDKPSPKHNPPLKDFDSYISQQKSNTQTISNLHSPKLGLNYTVSVTQDNASSSEKPLENKQNGFPKFETIKSHMSEVIPRVPKLTSPPKTTTVLNVPRKYHSSDHKEVSSTSSPAKLPKHKNAAPDRDQLNPDQILEKYNIQNLAQLTANFNFPPNLLTSTATQLAALRQAMIYKHFELQNHQNWLNMNPGPLVQYEQFLKSFSKSSS